MTIQSAAENLAAVLKASDRKVVFAESCTGGRVCGSLTAIAGISQYLCGGFVVYRNESKAAWLDLPLQELNERGAVRAEVAIAMAMGALNHTPDADFAISVTGHLGPGAPTELDGLVFVGTANRNRSATSTEINCANIEGRLQRQNWVVERVLEIAATT